MAASSRSGVREARPTSTDRTASSWPRCRWRGRVRHRPGGPVVQHRRGVRLTQHDRRRSGLWRTSSVERVIRPDWMDDAASPIIGSWVVVAPGDGTAQRYDPESFEPVGVPVLLNGFTQLAYATFERLAAANRLGQRRRQRGQSVRPRDRSPAGPRPRVRRRLGADRVQQRRLPARGTRLRCARHLELRQRLMGRHRLPLRGPQPHHRRVGPARPRTIDPRPTCDEYPA